MANWFYYDTQGNKYGPIDTAQIRILVQRGFIVPTTRMEDSIGRQGMARQLPGLFQNNPRQAPNQLDMNQGQRDDGSGWIGISLGISAAASVLSFIIAMFGINAIQKAIFYAQNSNRDSSVLNVAWRYHNYFNGWSVIGSVFAAFVAFGVAFLITWLVAKNKSQQ